MYCTTLKNNYILDIISLGEVGKLSILHLVTLTHTMLSLLYVVIFVIIQTFYLGAFDFIISKHSLQKEAKCKLQGSNMSSGRHFPLSSTQCTNHNSEESQHNRSSTIIHNIADQMGLNGSKWNQIGPLKKLQGSYGWSPLCISGHFGSMFCS